MARSVPEWIGKTDDARVPPHVQLRIRHRQTNDKGEVICGISGRPIKTADKKHLHHKLALCLGGEHRESNLVWVHADLNMEEAKREVAIRAANDARAKKHAGIRADIGPDRPLQGKPMATTRKAAARAARGHKPSLPVRIPRGFVSATDARPARAPLMLTEE